MADEPQVRNMLRHLSFSPGKDPKSSGLDSVWCFDVHECSQGGKQVGAAEYGLQQLDGLFCWLGHWWNYVVP